MGVPSGWRLKSQDPREGASPRKLSSHRLNRKILENKLSCRRRVQAASTPELSPWSLMTLKLTQVLCETVALPQSRGCAQVGFPEGLGKGSDEHNPWWNPTRTSNVLCFKICPCICTGGHPRLPSSQYGLGRATYTSFRGGQPSPQTGNFVPAFGNHSACDHGLGQMGSPGPKLPFLPFSFPPAGAGLTGKSLCLWPSGTDAP